MQEALFPCWAKALVKLLLRAEASTAARDLVQRLQEGPQQSILSIHLVKKQRKTQWMV